jgi:ABC-type cobalamin/Fe3+-siderophores transport system ATPase subunit
MPAGRAFVCRTAQRGHCRQGATGDNDAIGIAPGTPRPDANYQTLFERRTMSFIKDYNPLSTIKVRGLDEVVAAKGLVVIVGPNSSGKTRFLRDIELALLGSRDQPIVCENIRIQGPTSGEVFVNDLLEKKLIQKTQNLATVKLAKPHLGRGIVENREFELATLPGLCGFENEAPTGNKQDFLTVFGRLLMTSLFLENRLSLYGPQGRFDQISQTPQNELQALYMSYSAQKSLQTETGLVFRNVVWLDKIAATHLLLRVSGNPTPAPEEAQLDVDRAVTYRPLADEGDGLKSYVGIVISLLLGRRPVCLIDEPEMCLHPPQAFALGRFIGKYGTGEPHVTFVATHSSHILRGIIETAQKVTVLRLTNVAGQFRGYRLDDDELRRAIKRRTTRMESVLDGVFSQAVAIVEAEGDRAVYQAAAEGLDHDFEREIHFVSVNGTGGINEVCKFYRSLRIPVAIIADLDVVADRPKIQSFLEQLAPREEAITILQLCKSVEVALRAIPPTITEEEVRQELDRIKSVTISWATRDDEKVSAGLSALRSRIDRLHELKKIGLAAFDARQDIRRALADIIQRCAVVGLFIVPCGQLENWVPHLMQGVSKVTKWVWADEAATRIQEATDKKDDVWEFIRSVTTYLNDKAKAGRDR